MNTNEYADLQIEQLGKSRELSEWELAKFVAAVMTYKIAKPQARGELAGELKRRLGLR